MKLKASSRQRLLLYTALGLYDALVKSVHQGLTALDLSVTEILTAESRSGLARQAIERTKDTDLIEFTNPLSMCLVDALAIYYQKTEAQKKSVTKLQSGVAELEELQNEIKQLAVDLSNQPDIFADLLLADDDKSHQGDLLGGGVDGNGTPPPVRERPRLPSWEEGGL